jgi:hypothetical protein
LKEEALDRIKWRNRFGRGCGPVVWHYWWMMNVYFTPGTCRIRLPPTLTALP